MSSLLARFRNGDNSQGIRQSTALTTVYLLEMNRKFESFMRDKVEELEGRVAAQQARLSTKAEMADANAAWDEALIEEETSPVDELAWNEVLPIVDVLPETSPTPAVTDAPDLANRDAPIFDEPPPEQEPETEPEEPAEIPDYMTLLVGDQPDAEPEPPDEPMVELVAEEEINDALAECIDEPDDLPEQSEFVITANPQATARPDVEAVSNDIVAEEPSVEEVQTIEEGISALELLVETVDDTVPWFEEEQTDEAVLGDDIDPAPSGSDKVSADNTAAATAEIPTGTVPEDDDENGDWDADLPAEGQKGQWV